MLRLYQRSRINRFIRTSELEETYSVSISTRSIGMKGNNGALQQLNRALLLLLNIAFSLISCTVLAPLLVSVSDHSKLYLLFVI